MVINLSTKKIVIKIGGSILFDDHGRIEDQKIKKYASMIHQLVESKFEVCVVIGGGKPTRNIRDRLMHLTNSELDHISIKMTQVNALIFSFTLSRFMKTKFIENYEELFQDRVRYGHSDKVIVLGGLIPGQSTNAVAALACELLDCNLLINISSFDKIMIRDHDNVRVGETVDFMTYDELWGEIKNFNQTPSNYDLFDHNAFSIVKRSNIPILFLSQHKDLNKILNDKKYDYSLSTDNCEGTIVWSREN